MINSMITNAALASIPVEINVGDALACTDNILCTKPLIKGCLNAMNIIIRIRKAQKNKSKPFLFKNLKYCCSVFSFTIE